MLRVPEERRQSILGTCTLHAYSLPTFSSFMSEISRIAVDGVPSSESRWISFNATTSFVIRERPCDTHAVVETKASAMSASHR